MEKFRIEALSERLKSINHLLTHALKAHAEADFTTGQSLLNDAIKLLNHEIRKLDNEPSNASVDDINAIFFDKL